MRCGPRRPDRIGMKKIVAIMTMLSAPVFAAGQEPDYDQLSRLKDILMEEAIPAAEEPVGSILVIGDSMTAWMAERLNAYGKANGFDVWSVTWDGATIQKMSDSPRFAQIIEEWNPDMVVVSLGMNNIFEKQPEQRVSAGVDKILEAIGDRPYAWIGTPSWPGRQGGEILNDYMTGRLSFNFFRPFDLELPRASASNPHPTREGIEILIDNFVEWLRATGHPVNLDNEAEAGATAKCSKSLYRRMKQPL